MSICDLFFSDSHFKLNVYKARVDIENTGHSEHRTTTERRRKKRYSILFAWKNKKFRAESQFLLDREELKSRCSRNWTFVIPFFFRTK